MSLTWAGDWTTESGRDWLNLSAADPVPKTFRDAIVERVYAAQLGFPNYARATLAPGLDGGEAFLQVVYNGAARHAWGQDATDAAQVVLPFNLTGPPGWNEILRDLAHYFVGAEPVGVATIDSVTRVWSGGSAIDRKLPAGSGMTRRWRREIYSLDNAGTEGQRARFVAMDGAHEWYACPTTDAAYRTQPTTPVNDAGRAPFFYEYTAGAWVKSADQHSPADAVSESGLDSWPPGQCVDGHLINDVRDVTVELRRTLGARANSTVPVTYPDYFLPIPVYTGFTLGGSDAYPAFARGAWSIIGLSPDPGQAEADAKYDAAVDGSDIGLASGGIGIQKWQTSEGWFVETSGKSIGYPEDVTGYPNPDALNREASFWIRATAPVDSVSEWDTYGEHYAQDVWSEGFASGGSRVLSADIHPISPTLGVYGTPDAYTASHPSPWPTADAPAYRGWIADPAHVAIIFDWQVSGGFTYTADSP